MLSSPWGEKVWESVVLPEGKIIYSNLQMNKAMSNNYGRIAVDPGKARLL